MRASSASIMRGILRRILREAGAGAQSIRAHETQKQSSSSCGTAVMEVAGTLARGKAVATYSEARGGSRQMKLDETVAASAEVSGSMGIGLARIHTCQGSTRAAGGTCKLVSCCVRITSGADRRARASRMRRLQGVPAITRRKAGWRYGER